MSTRCLLRVLRKVLNLLESHLCQAKGHKQILGHKYLTESWQILPSSYLSQRCYPHFPLAARKKRWQNDAGCWAHPTSVRESLCRKSHY